MRVINNEKARSKTYLQNDIGSSITNILYQSNQLQEIISQLSQTLRGSASGVDQNLIASATQALQQFSQTSQYLHQAQSMAAQIDVTEEIPDEQY